MIIRTATINDIEKILILEEQIFGIHSSARPDWIDGDKRPFNKEFIKNSIENSNGKFFIAEEDGNTITGYCIANTREIKNHHMFRDMTTIEIDDLCVDAQYRKKGIGKMLFDEVVKYAKEKNAKFIELGVWEFNQNAKKFYEHLGMETRLCRMEFKVE
jgi:ribosomal protein S18 acetylase RimI-like enzyme